MNLYSSQREICLGQRFITYIFDKHFIYSHMYTLTKVIEVKHLTLFYKNILLHTKIKKLKK